MVAEPIIGSGYDPYWGGEDPGALAAQQEEEARRQRELLLPPPPPPPVVPPPAPVGDNLRNYAAQQAQEKGINPTVFDAQLQQESGYQNVVNPASGAAGIGQLMPGTAQDLGVNPMDPQQNIEGAARYYSQMLNMFNGDEQAALAAYNWGPGNVQQAQARLGPNWLSAAPEETQRYLNNILGAAQAPPPPPPPVQPPAQPPPAPPNLGAVVGQQMAAPVYGPPAPNPGEPWWQTPAAQQQFAAQANAGEVPVPAPAYTREYGPATAQLQAQSDVAGILGGGPFGIGNLTPGDIINPVLNQPVLNFIPGGSTLTGIGDLTGLGTGPTAGQAYMTDIPIYSDIARNYLVPAARQVGSVLAPAAAPGLGLASELLGGPSGADIGRMGGESLVPITAGDVALNALLAPEGANWLQRLDPTGLSVLNPAGVPQLARAPEALGGREAATIQLRNGVPAGAAVPEGTTPGIINELEALHRPNPAGYIQPPYNPDEYGVRQLPVFPSRPEIRANEQAVAEMARGGPSYGQTLPLPTERAPLGNILRQDLPNDRHILTLPDGSRSEWRGYPDGDAHLINTTVTVERQGTGTLLRQNVLHDIYTQNPAATVTADFNSEGGVRLFNRGAEPGQAHFYDRPGGREISMDEAIARVEARQGAAGEMTPPSAQRLQDLGVAGGRTPEAQALMRDLNAPPTPPGNISSETVQASGVPPDLATKIVNTWQRDQRVLQGIYEDPIGMARVAAGGEALVRPIEGATTGVYSDSFLNAVLAEKTNLERALANTSLSVEERAARVDGAVNKMIADHYPNNPGKVSEVQQALTNREARAKELAHDFRAANALNDTIKTTVAGPLDFAFAGQAMLSGGRQAGLQTLAGTVNRIATALGHPLLNMNEITGLPNLAAKELAGVDFRRGGILAEIRKPNTVLGAFPGVNPLAGVDKNVVVPFIQGLEKAQFQYLGGWMKNSAFDGQMMQQYVVQLGKNLASGKGLGEASQLARDYIARPDVQRDIGRWVNNSWSSSRGALTPGRAQAERLALFSSAYTRSQFGRIADVTKLITPGASEAQRVMAAGTILSSVAMIGGLYKFLNDRFGVGDAVLDPFKQGYGQIVLPQKDSNGHNVVVNLAPQQTIQNALTRSFNAIKGGNPEDLKDIWLRVGLSREGILPGYVSRGLGYGYDTSGKFYSPFTDSGKMPLLDRLQGSAPVPFSIQQNVFQGAPVSSLSTGLNVLGASTYGENPQSTAFRERTAARAEENRALLSGDTLRQAFPNNPDIAAILQGRDWNALTIYEKDAIAKASPDVAKALEAATKESAQANQERPTAVGNAIAIREQTQANVDKIEKTYNEGILAKLGGYLFDGKHDPYLVRLAISEAEKELRKDTAQERWKGSTTYTGLPWPQGNDKSSSLVQEAIARWDSMGNSMPKNDKGQINFDALDAAKLAYLDELKKESPDTFARLSFYIQQRDAGNIAQKPEQLQFLDRVQSGPLNTYYDQPEGQRTDWVRSHPWENAQLWVAGYLPYLYSGAAVVLANQIAPDRQPVVRR